MVALLALALQVHLPLCGHDGLDIVGLAQGFHPHIIVHAEQGVLQISTGEAVLRDLTDTAILHVAAEQPGQHHADLRFALAAAAFNDHHALALVAGDRAVANELLHGGNVLRVEQVGQEPQPMGGLWGFRVIPDREPVADDLRLALLKGAVQIQGAVCQRNAVGDGREVLHLFRQLQHVHHIGDLLGKVRPNVFTHHLEDLTPQGHGVHHSAVRGEKCAIRVKQLVGAQKIVAEQGFVEKSFLEPCRGKITYRHSVLSLALRKNNVLILSTSFYSATEKSTSCRSPCMAFLPPFRRRFPALLLRVMAGYPMQTVMRFSRSKGQNGNKKAVTKQTSPAFAFLEGHASRLCNG